MSKTVNDIMQMKSKEKITVLTGYDSTMTTLCDKADVILVEIVLEWSCLDMKIHLLSPWTKCACLQRELVMEEKMH